MTPTMPSKRDVLQVLSRDELVALVDLFELTPPDRRSKDGLVETVASSKKTRLSDVLSELSRDRLKEICRELDLDDSGREKGGLVERLSRTAGSVPPKPIHRSSAPRSVAPPSEKPPKLVHITRLVSALRRTLWKQGFVTPEALTHARDERGDHVFRVVIPRDLCEDDASDTAPTPADPSPPHEYHRGSGHFDGNKPKSAD
jgi:type I restriction enzyme M protein